MDSNVRFILDVIVYVLKGGSTPRVPKDLNWKKVYDISVAHAVICIVSYGVMVADYGMDEEVRRLFLQKMYTGIAIDQKQRQDCKEIFEAFEAHSLDYMPLKGAILKEVYPESEMRSMSDVDILIRSQQFCCYEEILLNLGYHFAYESNHECVFQKQGSISVELHKYVIPSYNDDMYAYYETGWDIARKKENQVRWEFTKEDFYVYLIAHFAKHYRDAGAGIKYVIDMWLWKERYAMDIAYIERQLTLLNLERFASNLEHLIQVWFFGKEPDQVIEQMTDFIINSGEYGNLQNAGNARFLRMSSNGGKKKEKYKCLYLLFPNKETMAGIYPIVKRFGWLLPWFWIYRIVTWVLFRRQTLASHKKMLEGISSEGIETYFSHMEMVGLDIYNGRK